MARAARWVYSPIFGMVALLVNRDRGISNTKARRLATHLDTHAGRAGHDSCRAVMWNAHPVLDVSRSRRELTAERRLAGVRSDSDYFTSDQITATWRAAHGGSALSSDCNGGLGELQQEGDPPWTVCARADQPALLASCVGSERNAAPR